jgi:hypothetical protein
MFEFLKSKNYQILFSFLLGLFIVLIIRPSCKDDSCIKHMNPNSQEISNKPKSTQCITDQINIQDQN